MDDALFHDLQASLNEAIHILRADVPPAREAVYVGKVLVEVREGGHTTWSLQQAAETLAQRLPAHSIPLVNPRIQFIREALGQTQEGFAELLGASVDTLRAWEQGKRNMSGAARKLFSVATSNPMAVLESPSVFAD